MRRSINPGDLSCSRNSVGDVTLIKNSRKESSHLVYYSKLKSLNFTKSLDCLGNNHLIELNASARLNDITGNEDTELPLTQRGISQKPKLQNKFEKLQQENYDLQIALEDSQRQCDWLRRSLANAKKQIEENSIMTKRYKLLEDENKELKEKISELEQELNDEHTKK